MFEIKKFEQEDVPDVIAFERELRRQEPDTYYWEPDETYAGNLERCFDDPLFNTAMSFIALKNGCVSEQGSFDELMELKGYFYSLFTVSQR